MCSAQMSLRPDFSVCQPSLQVFSFALPSGEIKPEGWGTSKANARPHRQGHYQGSRSQLWWNSKIEIGKKKTSFAHFGAPPPSSMYTFLQVLNKIVSKHKKNPLDPFCVICVAVNLCRFTSIGLCFIRMIRQMQATRINR